MRYTVRKSVELSNALGGGKSYKDKRFLGKKTLIR